MDKSTYCKYPFKQIAIKEFKGTELTAFWPCCMMGNQIDKESVNRLEIENVHLLTPEEMYNHPRMELLRYNLLNGIKDSACKVCWQQEEKGLDSFRLRSYTDPSIEEDGLSMIDLTTSNICNLRCRMCTPSNSHQLMKDHQFFEKNNLLDKVDLYLERWAPGEPPNTLKSPQWDWMMKNTQKIKFLKASGGEPFYDNKVIQLLKKYVETGSAKDSTLSFHTNATQFNNDEIIEILNEFKVNRHVFSIDGVEKVFEYIRYPGIFTELEESVINYAAKIKNYEFLNFTMILTAHNILNVDSYLSWAKKIDKEASFKFAEVYTFDRGIAIKHLPIKILEEAKGQAVKHISRGVGREDGDVVNLVTQIDNAIKFNSENKVKLKGETELFDLSRNQSYRDYLHPMLVEWLDSDE